MSLRRWRLVPQRAAERGGKKFFFPAVARHESVFFLSFLHDSVFEERVDLSHDLAANDRSGRQKSRPCAEESSIDSIEGPSKICSEEGGAARERFLAIPNNSNTHTSCLLSCAERRKKPREQGTGRRGGGAERGRGERLDRGRSDKRERTTRRGRPRGGRLQRESARDCEER